MQRPPAPPPLAAGDPVSGETPEPPEILRSFLEAAEPHTLVLTGNPGVGKTTLALSLLARIDRPCFYISTRVGRGNLLHHFPWLVGTLPPDRLIDIEDVRPSSNRQEDLIQLLDGLTDTVDPLSAGKRLLEFLNFPRAAAQVLAQPPTRPGQRILYIDSWEGLTEPYVHLLGLDEFGRSSMEHGLLSLFHAAGCSLVLCAESASPQALQYLADGVVELKAEAIDGGLIRHLEVKKLRGRAISHMEIAYSLHGGRFTACPPLPHLLRGTRGFVLPRVPPPHADGTLSLGVPGIDEAMGPITGGDTLLTEVVGGGSTIPLTAAVGSLYLAALDAGWKVTILPDLAFPPSALQVSFHHVLPKVNLAEYLTLLPAPSRSRLPDLEDDLEAALQPKNLLGLSTRSLAALTGERGEDLLTRIANLRLLAREQRSLLLLGVGQSDPLLPMLSTLVPLHMKVRSYFGTYLVAGQYPTTPYHAVLVEDGAGPAYRYRFVPMV